MASVNKTCQLKHKTTEGAPAKTITAEQELMRSVCSCLLWEKEFYEDGKSIAARIQELVAKVDPGFVMALAQYARNQHNLRHIPLFLAKCLVRNGYNIRLLLPAIIQRPDELTEFLALYWQEGKVSLDNSVKKGLAAAFRKFDAYQLAKYNRSGKAIRLRDVLFLCHAKPKDKEQELVWKKLADGTLESPDTWEVSLSKGADKKETWERLLSENKLGSLALLRNLRNMEQQGVSRNLIINAIRDMKTDKVLPFRFIAAARHAPSLEPFLEDALLKSFDAKLRMCKKINLLVDVSGSMDYKLSEKSDLTRLDAACGVAICAREMFSDVRVFTFSNEIKEVAARRGFALRDAIVHSQEHRGTYLGEAVKKLNGLMDPDATLIVFTDEQSHDPVPNPKGKGYMVNVASNRNGVGYGKWDHVDGFSESVMTWILEREKEK